MSQELSTLFTMGEATVENLASTPSHASPYRVLARAYRPQQFSDVIGQETTVLLLKNGLQQQKLGHGFIFTGIRGVGKTTLARLVAKALNCTADKASSVEPCGACESCQALAQGRHFDIIEMDAASHTGVEDMREVIEASRYRALAGRYKIFIIDEVHMLSKSAFNALLKTLEEPPAHVKFLFATTEIQRVPATILSRCLRFDLRRIQPTALQAYLEQVCEKERVTVDAEALRAIAHAADGSVRDALSLLDQAILMAQGSEAAASPLPHVSFQAVQTMLGLVDRKPFLELFNHLLQGQIEETLRLSRELYQSGADPLLLLEDLLDLSHQLSLHKAAPSLQLATVSSEETLDALKKMAAGETSLAHLGRIWQMLLKGRGEVKDASFPLQALEMVLLRIAHMAHFPTPEALAQSLAGKAPRQPEVQPPKALSPPAPTISTATTTASPLTSFEDLLALAAQKREGLLCTHLKEAVHLIRWSWGELHLNLKPSAPSDLLTQLKQFLKQETGIAWNILTTPVETCPPTLAEQADQHKTDLVNQALATPLLQKAKQAFPEMTLEQAELV
ncbi:MAG: DNA polymerase III subunit gamma/tau [Alphaproteobacteria bacterium]